MTRCAVLALLVVAMAPCAAVGQSYTISGRTTVGILSLPGVTLTGLPGNPVTDSSGNYSVTVAAGFSATITPTKDGYAFTPASRTYTNVTSNQTQQDYSGSLQSHIISGRVTVGLVSLPGVTLSGLPGNPVTDSSGNYSVTVAAGFSATVTPTKDGYAFTPASRTYTNVTSNQTQQDYSGSLQSYTISGRVTVGLVSLPGVTLTGLPGNPVTDSSGNYSVTVAPGFNATVTPTKDGYAFTPASRTYTNVTSNQAQQDYSGSLQSYTISGRVMVGLVSLQGVTLSGLPGNPVTDANGNYSVTVASGFSATVTPAKDGYAFTPASRTYANVTGNQTQQDYSGSLQSYTISGRVMVGLVSLQGVTLSGLPGNPVTDANGNYSATVAFGFSGTVTPGKAGHTFTPASRTYTYVTANQAQQDYVATFQSYTISGRVTAGIMSLPGVTLSGLPGNPVTDSSGNYSVTVASGFSATVTPVKAGYAFNPASRTYGNVTAHQTQQNYAGTAASCPDWYHDADGDTYGNAADSLASCTQPIGYVSDDTDCDDRNDAIHPGAAEVCGNGIDEDCLGGDEPCSSAWYRDADGDQYGDPTDTMTSVSPPAGYVSNHADCNDLRLDVHPGMAEVCGDDVDNNCSGQVDEGCITSPPPPMDTDHDGVTDERDLCPGTVTGTAVDTQGCAAGQRDSDGDGVTDDLDRCPGTPPGAQVRFDGCVVLSDGDASPLDDDADGVPNAADRCPGTAAGAAVDNGGCALVEPAEATPAPPAAACGSGAAAAIAGIITGWALVPRRRPRRT